MNSMTQCPLCEHKRITHHYYEDDNIWIADCLTCKVPMIVWKKHQKDLDKNIKDKLSDYAKKSFGNQVKIRWLMRNIKDHFHFHIENMKEEDLHQKECDVELALGISDVEDSITLEQVLKSLPSAITIEKQPFLAYLRGRIVDKGKISKEEDIELVLKQEPDSRAIMAIKGMMPSWLADKIHITFNNESSVANNIPIYKKGFFKTSRREQFETFGELSGEVKPFMKIKALQSKIAMEKYTDFYNNWVTKYLDRGIVLQRDYDGFRFLIHKEGDTIQILSGISFVDRANEMPNIVKELLDSKVDSFILDGTAVAYDCGNKSIGSAWLKSTSCDRMYRGDSMWIIEGKITPKQEDSIVFHIHDILYMNGESLSDKPYFKDGKGRLSILTSGFMSPRDKFFTVAKTTALCKTPASINKYASEIVKGKYSTGLIAKVSDSKYPITTKDNKTQEWCRLKFSSSISTELSNLKLCLCQYNNEKWCPLQNVIDTLEENKIKFPLTCKLANIYKCYYIKNCFYEDEKDENTNKN